MSVDEAWSDTTSTGVSSALALGSGGGDYVALASSNWRIAYSETPDGPWSTRDLAGGTPSGRALYGVHYADGRWVLTGNNGRIFTATSPAGTWTRATEPTSNTLFDIVYAEGVWVTVGASGKIYTATSPDGTWTARTSGTTETLYAVAHGGGKFVAVGTGGTIIYADDPTGAWSAAISGASGSSVFTSVAHGDGRWLVGGYLAPFTLGQLAKTATDPSGTWSTATPGGVFDYYGFGGIRYLDGYWLACGRSPGSGAGEIRYTQNPTGSWTSVALPAPGTYNYNFMTFDGDVFAVLAASGIHHQPAGGVGWGLILR